MYSAQAVIEKVMSFHSSRQSLSQSIGSGSALNMATGSGGTAGRGGPQQYSPIREESREAVTRKNSQQSGAAAAHDDETINEYIGGLHTADVEEFRQKNATEASTCPQGHSWPGIQGSESQSRDKATREINANTN